MDNITNEIVAEVNSSGNDFHDVDITLIRKPESEKFMFEEQMIGGLPKNEVNGAERLHSGGNQFREVLIPPSLLVRRGYLKQIFVNLIKAIGAPDMPKGFFGDSEVTR